MSDARWRSCDLCKAAVAPFGFAPPPRLGIQVRRPIFTCGAQECRDQARDRVRALIERHDPFARRRSQAAAGPPDQSAQPSLFSS